jgi:hypothetical protein
LLATQLEQVKATIPVKWQPFVEIALAVLAIYFRANPKV